MGGLPSWLLRDPSMRVRSSHEGFLAAARNYLQWLLPLVVPLQQSLGGPIIAVQVRSEPRRDRAVRCMRDVKKSTPARTSFRPSCGPKAPGGFDQREPSEFPR